MSIMACALNINISPDQSIPLFGYSERIEPFVAIDKDLEANILILRDGSEDFVFLSVDLLYASDELIAHVLNQKNLRLDPSRIIIMASHTHFAPPIDVNKPKLGEANAAYRTKVVERITRALDGVQDSLFEKVLMREARKNVKSSVKRRKKGWIGSRKPPFIKAGIRFAPNPRDTKNDRIQILELISESSEQTICILWNYACHPVGYPNFKNVHPDFPGIVRDALRLTHNDDRLPVLFGQGFSGDVRPRSTAFKWRPSIIFNPHREFVPFTLNGYLNWAKRLANDTVDACLKAKLVRVDSISTNIVRIPLASIIEGNLSGQSIEILACRLGPIVFLCVSAEVASDYQDFIKQQGILKESDRLFCVSCINSVPCYLPTDRMVAEGGYEASEFFELFSLEGKFRLGMEGTVLAHMIQALVGASQGK